MWCAHSARLSQGDNHVRTIRYLSVLFAVLSLTLPAALWAQNHAAPAAAIAAGNSASASTAPAASDHPQPAERYPRYTLNRLDVLSLTFPISPELDQPKVEVQPDGYVTLLSANPVYVLGMTVPEATEAVKKAYANILHDPIVNIDLVDFQHPYFVVLGQVAKPGQYDLRYEMTVTEAIALGGGFLPTAKTHVYLYHREGAGWREVRELNLREVLTAKNLEEPLMQPGDMIFVPEKSITKVRKYIPYGIGIGTGIGFNGSYW
jgi:polysaccharide biosynthesis/export protein